MTSPTAFADLVAVMDQLRSPGGCPWDAEQTHQSLVRYALEEAYEVAEAVEQGDRDALREELGDLLLQVVFHARIAAEHPSDPFDLDDVAVGIAAKLRRRHPHVFAGAEVRDAAHVSERWEQIKRAEKGRTSVLDGIPVDLPALARAQKVLSRARSAGLSGLPGAAPTGAAPTGAAPTDAVPTGAAPTDAVPTDAAHEAADTLGRDLLTAVARAEELGVDAEQSLRTAIRVLETDLRAREKESTR